MLCDSCPLIVWTGLNTFSAHSWTLYTVLLWYKAWFSSLLCAFPKRHMFPAFRNNFRHQCSATMWTVFFSFQLINGGEDVLIFYNDRASFPVLLRMMCSERDRGDENSPLAYHITLVELLAACTEGKNVYTEIKCNSLLPLDDIVRVVTHDDCIPEVSPGKEWEQHNREGTRTLMCSIFPTEG